MCLSCHLFQTTRQHPAKLVLTYFASDEPSESLAQNRPGYVKVLLYPNGRGVDGPK